MPVFTRISWSCLGLPRKSSTWMVETRVTKTATKRDDYTRLQNLNALFSVIGSSSTSEETLQLQRTLSFMRENDSDAQMSVKSFEHCIEQVVRFHFPQDRAFLHPLERSCRFHRPAVGKSFGSRFHQVLPGSVAGCFWSRVCANPCSEGANDGPPKKSVNIRNSGHSSKAWSCVMPVRIKTLPSSSSEAEF